MPNILSTGLSGLNAAQAGLITTGHNIANAATPGFSRQVIDQSAGSPEILPFGALGRGVDIIGVKRNYSAFAAGQVLTAQTRSAELGAYSNQVSQLSDLFGDASTGLSPVLQNFFSSVQQVATQPNSIPARQAVISSAESLVARFKSLDQQMTEIRNGINTQLSDAVTNVNSYAKQIAEINQRILVAQGSNSQLPNDLLDQRDQIVSSLNQEIRVTSVLQSDGTTNLYIGSGQPLVVGVTNQELKTVPDSADVSRTSLALVLPGGSSNRLQESILSGGRIGGLLSFRSQSLDQAQSSLGRIAVGIAQTFNTQHQNGQTIAGGLGGAFFTTPPGQAFATNTPPNTGNLALDVQIAQGGASALTDSDYSLSFSSGAYSLTRKNDGVVVSSGAGLPLSADGFTVNSASGTPSDGDSFLIRPARIGALNLGLAITDPREIAAAMPLRTNSPISNSGTGTISAGSVSSTSSLSSFPVTLTYSSSAGGFSGLPINTTVSVTTLNGVKTDYTISSTNPTFPYSSGATVSFNGFSTSISGQPANGDQFVIERNTGGTGDNRNALALGGLQTINTLLADSSATPTANFQSAYAQLVSSVGNKAREVQVTQAATDNLVTQAKETEQSVSGVNLDEEAANLIRYQQAYQASGKVIEIASKLFDTVLSAVSR